MGNYTFLDEFPFSSLKTVMDEIYVVTIRMFWLVVDYSFD